MTGLITGCLSAACCFAGQPRGLTAPVSVKELPEIHVVYTEYKGDHEGKGHIYDELLGKILAWAVPNGLWDFPETTKIIMIYPDPPSVPKDKRRLWLGITLEKKIPVPEALCEMTLPSAAYAVGSFEIPARQFGEAWSYMYGQWLPGSGYRAAEGLSFELQKNDSSEHPEGKHLVDICIPVCKK